MIIFGISFHAIGAVAGGSFYMVFRKVKKWSWETYWFINSLFAWFIVPWVVTVLTVPKLKIILWEAPLKSIFWTFLFGMLWGVGGITYGLSLRYLGLSLGIALALGLTTTFGTLLPPLFLGTFKELVSSVSGWMTLGGIFVCLVGIAGCGWAGISKENELSPAEKQKYIKEFHFKKGLTVTILCGFMSACYAFALFAGKPIADIAVKYKTPALWQNSVVLVFVLTGGFVTNAIYCVSMNIKNRSIGNYSNSGDVPLLRNYMFCALAGTISFMEYMFYGMGMTQMGKYDFASLSIHLAFLIIVSNMWGLITHEWKGCSKRTIKLLLLGLFILIISTVVIGVGNYLAPPE